MYNPNRPLISNRPGSARRPVVADRPGLHLLRPRPARHRHPVGLPPVIRPPPRLVARPPALRTTQQAPVPGLDTSHRRGECTAQVPAHTGTAGYVGSASKAGDKAFFDAVLKSVAKRQAANPTLKVVTVYYNAPSFRSQISNAASIWNSSVSNVKLQVTSGSADFTYRTSSSGRREPASWPSQPGRRSAPPCGGRCSP